jgi:hypothetical protein
VVIITVCPYDVMDGLHHFALARRWKTADICAVVFPSLSFLFYFSIFLGVIPSRYHMLACLHLLYF